MQVKFIDDAKAEFFAASLYYEEQSEGLGDDFLVEVKRAAADIGSHPEAWPLRGDGTRRHLLDRFPYVLVYLIHDECIWIVAVAHCRQRPTSYHERTPRSVGASGD